MVYFQYFHNETAVPPAPAISLLLFLPQQYSRLFCIIALRRGLEEERTERLLERRKTFRITVHSSSNKLQLSSASQIELQKIQLQVASNFRLAFGNADLKVKCQNLGMAICLLTLCAFLPHQLICLILKYLPLSKQPIHMRVFKALQSRAFCKNMQQFSPVNFCKKLYLRQVTGF